MCIRDSAETGRDARARLRDALRPRYPYPTSLDQMNAKLKACGIEPDGNLGPDFYRDMLLNDWTTGRGTPVFDWIATYKARMSKIEASVPDYGL